MPLAEGMNTALGSKADISAAGLDPSKCSYGLRAERGIFPDKSLQGFLGLRQYKQG